MKVFVKVRAGACRSAPPHGGTLESGALLCRPLSGSVSGFVSRTFSRTFLGTMQINIKLYVHIYIIYIHLFIYTYIYIYCVYIELCIDVGNTLHTKLR